MPAIRASFSHTRGQRRKGKKDVEIKEKGGKNQDASAAAAPVLLLAPLAGRTRAEERHHQKLLDGSRPALKNLATGQVLYALNSGSSSRPPKKTVDRPTYTSTVGSFDKSKRRRISIPSGPAEPVDELHAALASLEGYGITFVPGLSPPPPSPTPSYEELPPAECDAEADRMEEDEVSTTEAELSSSSLFSDEGEPEGENSLPSVDCSPQKPSQGDARRRSVKAESVLDKAECKEEHPVQQPMQLTELEEELLYQHQLRMRSFLTPTSSLDSLILLNKRGPLLADGDRPSQSRSPSFPPHLPSDHSPPSSPAPSEDAEATLRERRRRSRVPSPEANLHLLNASVSVPAALVASSSSSRVTRSLPYRVEGSVMVRSGMDFDLDVELMRTGEWRCGVQPANASSHP